MQVPLCGRKGSMAHLQINDGIGCGKTFVPGQLFAFGSIVLHADSTGHLGQVENFSPGQTIRFGNLEYAADSRGDLAFSGWVSDQPENPSSTTVPAPDSISEQGVDQSVSRSRL